MKFCRGAGSSMIKYKIFSDDVRNMKRCEILSRCRMLSITVFWFWCASRAPTLTHVDLNDSFGKAGARQLDSKVNKLQSQEK